MDIPAASQLEVATLGPCRVPSPLRQRREQFTSDSRVLVCNKTAEIEPFVGQGPLPAFEAAGPRADIFFDPAELTCGIVTCGGLCPGLNDVIRSLFLTLHHGYGVRRVLGFRYGYNGLTPDPLSKPLQLDEATVEGLNHKGGTLLGSSRGNQDITQLVDQLQHLGVGILFAIGGDGTLRGAHAIAEEVRRRGAELSIIGIPKTIDNDLMWTQRTFGFATAVEEAQSVIDAAHTEARAVWHGVGLVKLMGRHAGFIAAHATLASGDVNFCLVPEVPFTLDGPGGLVELLVDRLQDRRHAVIVVAEGAGQHLINSVGDAGRDLSGNQKLKDIGRFLREQLRSRFADRQIPLNIKYIDPSYIIRGQPANSADSSFCLMLGQHAVHAGMAGRSHMMVGFWNHCFTHVPLALVADRPKALDPRGETWQRVLEATGQPPQMVARD